MRNFFRTFFALALVAIPALSPLSARADATALFEQLKSRYALAEKTPYEPSLMQNWWEGSVNNSPVAFQQRGEDITVFVGRVEEITDIYLIRITADNPAPSPETTAHLERIAGPEGKALASQFYLAAYPSSGDFDFPQLRIPALRDGITKLSPSVSEVAIFESHKGLSFNIAAAGATVETIEEDLKLAQAMVQAMEQKQTQ